MKTISNVFRNHLDSAVTALCTCWKITRRDGVVLTFTDSDQDVTRGGLTYKSIGAYKRSAVESTSSLSVDNLEVSGMATELALPVEELRAGAYDNATVEVFMTPWIQSIGGRLNLRKGFFGEVRVIPNGTFTVEIRGIMQKLAHTYTDVFSATCRHDLGDAGCKVDLTHPFATEGAHIPFPLKDPDFEDVGLAGLGASFTWYNPENNEELVSDADSYSGTYSAHGPSLGGVIQQDVDITPLGEDFLDNIDRRQVDLYMHAWRKDDGDEGRIRYHFLDSDYRRLRASCGFLAVTSGVAIPQVVVSGNWTLEGWFKRNTDSIHTFFGYRLDSTSARIRALWYTPNSNELRWFAAEGGVNTNSLIVTKELPVGEWFHLALVGDSTGVSLYMDGTLLARDPTPLAADLVIDGIGQGYIGNLSGGIDEARIWNVARSQAEINRDRFKDLAGGNAQLSRYYPFDGDRVDYGFSGSADLVGGTLDTGFTPVRVALRGTTSGSNTTFEDVGTEWVIRETGAVEVPPHTRFVRVLFDSQPNAGTPTGSRIDSIFGWFKDGLNEKLMPNFSVGDNEAVWTRAGMVTIGGDGRTFRAVIDEPRATQEGWYHGGLVTFYTGENAGASMEVKKWSSETNQVELFLSLPYNIKQGDLFTIYPGCDKTRIGCRVLFNNVINFFGTPDVPGEDELFRYPDAK